MNKFWLIVLVVFGMIADVFCLQKNVFAEEDINDGDNTLPELYIKAINLQYIENGVYNTLVMFYFY